MAFAGSFFNGAAASGPRVFVPVAETIHLKVGQISALLRSPPCWLNHIPLTRATRSGASYSLIRLLLERTIYPCAAASKSLVLLFVF